MAGKKPEPKLCVDCAHFKVDHGFACCGALIGKPSPVTGKPIGRDSYEMVHLIRMSLCGWDYPRLWQPKAHPPKKR
jgi:hypothetical protein